MLQPYSRLIISQIISSKLMIELRICDFVNRCGHMAGGRSTVKDFVADFYKYFLIQCFFRFLDCHKSENFFSSSCQPTFSFFHQNFLFFAKKKMRQRNNICTTGLLQLHLKSFIMYHSIKQFYLNLLVE